MFRLVSPQEEEDNFQSFRGAVAADRDQGRRPLFCLANVHSTLFHRQNVTALQVITGQYFIQELLATLSLSLQ